MSEAFIRGCTRATSPEDKVRISVAATPFPLPDKARQPFHVEDTIIARDSGDAPGAGPRMMNLMEVLIKQNFNLAKRSDSHAGPLILVVESMDALMRQPTMKTLLHQHCGIEHLNLMLGPGMLKQNNHVDNDQTSIQSFCIDLPTLVGRPAGSNQHYESGLAMCDFSEDENILFIRISTYVIGRRTCAGVIVFVESLNPVGMVGLLADHYRGNSYRAQRLKDPLWIFCDIVSLFETTEVIACISRELKKTSDNGFRDIQVENLQDLHSRKIRAVIDVSETIYVTTAVCEDILNFYASYVSSDNFGGEEFLVRVQELKSHLVHDEHRLTVIRQQFQNLVDLCCSVIAIQQGVSVNRLTVLGAVFIPLSFVASIFGITELHVNPMYFPVSAVPTSVIVLLVAWLFSRYGSGNTRKTSRSGRTAPFNEGFIIPNQLPLFVPSPKKTWRLRSPFSSSVRPTIIEESPSSHGQREPARLIPVRAYEYLAMPTAPPNLPHRAESPDLNVPEMSRGMGYSYSTADLRKLSRRPYSTDRLAARQVPPPRPITAPHQIIDAMATADDSVFIIEGGKPPTQQSANVSHSGESESEPYHRTRDPARSRRRESARRHGRYDSSTSSSYTRTEREQSDSARRRRRQERKRPFSRSPRVPTDESRRGAFSDDNERDYYYHHCPPAPGNSRYLLSPPPLAPAPAPAPTPAPINSMYPPPPPDPASYPTPPKRRHQPPPPPPPDRSVSFDLTSTGQAANSPHHPPIPISTRPTTTARGSKSPSSSRTPNNPNIGSSPSSSHIRFDENRPVYDSNTPITHQTLNPIPSNSSTQPGVLEEKVKVYHRHSTIPEVEKAAGMGTTAGTDLVNETDDSRDQVPKNIEEVEPGPKITEIAGMGTGYGPPTTGGEAEGKGPAV